MKHTFPKEWKKFTVQDDPLTLYYLEDVNDKRCVVHCITEDGEQEDYPYLKEQVEEIFAKGSWKFVEEGDTKENSPQYTGGSSNYYKVFVKNPTTLGSPYEAECNDIIEALDMTFAEGNAFKAIWRKAKARQGVQKKGYDNGLYDSEKVVFFGERMAVEAKEKGNESI